MSNDRRPLLTIGIPTFNRQTELREGLECLLAQVSAEREVEILICDNASEDETRTYVEDIATRYDFLRYSRNDTNIGPDLNFIGVLRQARGRHVWILSDDDFVTDGAVAEVLRIIRSYDPSHISLSYLYCNKDGKMLPHQPHKDYVIKEDQAHADINRIFLARNHWLSFLSCNVYRRDLADCDDFAVNRGNVPNWIQVYMTAQVLAKGRDGYLSSFVAVLARAGNDRTNVTPFIEYMPEAFTYIFQKFGVNDSVANSVLCGIRRTFLPFHSFVVHRAKGVRISPLIVPASYRVGLLLPKGLIRLARSATHLLEGRRQPAKNSNP